MVPLELILKKDVSEMSAFPCTHLQCEEPVNKSFECLFHRISYFGYPPSTSKLNIARTLLSINLRARLAILF